MEQLLIISNANKQLFLLYLYQFDYSWCHWIYCSCTPAIYCFEFLYMPVRPILEIQWENILQLQLSCKWSRNCCSCKLHMLSVGILTYTATLAIHTSPGTSSGSMHIADLCFALHQLTLAVAVFIFHGKHMLSCASGRGVHVTNNVVLTKWRIALSITLECLRTTEECIECYDHDK